MTIRNSLQANSHFYLEDKIFCELHKNEFLTFENTYLQIRESEGRIYSNTVLKKLPSISWFHPLKKEWIIRAQSFKMLVSYLKSVRHETILEIGCGNGWLSHQLAVSLQAEVLGLDVNKTELHQAANVFSSFDKLTFTYGDIFTMNLGELKFDQIILAASIQYFPAVSPLINRLLSILNTEGEIHILDSSFYSVDELQQAQERTRAYYDRNGAPGMGMFYHHHTIKEFDSYKPIITKYPTSIFYGMRKLVTQKEESSFYWVRIRK